MVDRGLQNAAAKKTNWLLMIWYLWLELYNCFGKQRLCGFCLLSSLLFRGTLKPMLCFMDLRNLISSAVKDCFPLNILWLHLHFPATTLPSFITHSKCFHTKILCISPVSVPCRQVEYVYTWTASKQTLTACTTPSSAVFCVTFISSTPKRSTNYGTIAAKLSATPTEPNSPYIRLHAYAVFVIQKNTEWSITAATRPTNE